MAIQFRRGTESEWDENKNNIVAGEPVITIDTGKLFVGTTHENFVQFPSIVEEGTVSKDMGAWTYRKWSNGVLEQWYKSEKLTFNESEYSAWGKLYYVGIGKRIFNSNTFHSLEYPVAFVGNDPIKIITILGADGDSWATGSNGGAPLEWTGAIYAVSAAQGTRTITISIYARGMWK